jgi:hypothetical protein
MTRMTPAIRSSFKFFVSKIVDDQNRHRPWVLKDPRMMVFTKDWPEQVRFTCCVRYIFWSRVYLTAT